MSLTPANQPACSSDWLSQEEGGGCQGVSGAEHAPLSPQSSVASSGSEQTEEQSNTRNTFQEDGSGMKDVPAWLKSLRLHKYASLFSQMTYEEMMILTEQHLESQNVTKGARHKIALSIQKLRERQSVLKSLEKDILEGGNVRNALQELQQIIITPIKVYAPPTAAQKEVEPVDKAANPGEEKESEGFQTHNPPACDGESPSAPIGDGDIAGQFTRVMGKVCTQLLVSRPDEENISCYLQLIEKCLTHEAFTETQKKRLLSWKQQVLKLLRLFPRKTVMDSSVYRRGWQQYGSNSLPTAGSVSAGLGRQRQRPFQMPPRGAPPPGRMGLMSAGGLTGASPRHSLANPPAAVSAQGRQNLWFGNPGGSNSMPSQSRSSVQRTHSLPVHTSPQTMLLFQQQECQVPGTDLEINPTLESLCLSMTEHALGGTTNQSSPSSRATQSQRAVIPCHPITAHHRLAEEGAMKEQNERDLDELLQEEIQRRPDQELERKHRRNQEKEEEEKQEELQELMRKMKEEEEEEKKEEEKREMENASDEATRQFERERNEEEEERRHDEEEEEEDEDELLEIEAELRKVAAQLHELRRG
uniref:Sterile alpha motif domain containing 4B n=1 Tax=Cyprinus carpio TaxID=7962 RepID=A0A8C1ZNM8_CYPCA